MFDRILDLSSTLKIKSLFLFGPRQTGKTTYLGKQFGNALNINLLHSQKQLELLGHPHRLREIIKTFKPANNQDGRLIIIDEIQKIPALLDEVHLHIEEYKNDRFILTGSSARKLKKTGINLLGGRARMHRLEPIVHPERKKQDISWRKSLQWGGLPAVLLSENPANELYDYIDVYLNEEIKAEALVRSLPAFSRFLEIAAANNAEQVVYDAIASDVGGISAVTIKEYFQVLEDTLVGSRLHAFQKTVKRKPVSSPKFYFFDTGIANTLLKRNDIMEKTPEYGQALEHLVYCELRAFVSYRIPKRYELFFWRTQSRHEVDFILLNPDQEITAIEVKAASNVTDRHLAGLRAIKQETGIKIIHSIIVCNESSPRTTEDGIQILPVEQFLDFLWSQGPGAAS
ncbi:MAG: hypothetical protein A2583_07145 [Bdellovibrionales bacterium RIFOXYD1_FULL_53_11]|nr:MAG: hypothetical protein A2583_07145 [Bdellovibrionales bacterium RIFOXYD1_FULL_53_11]